MFRQVMMLPAAFRAPEALDQQLDDIRNFEWHKPNDKMGLFPDNIFTYMV